MNVLMFKQVVGRIFNADNVFLHGICCCMYDKKTNYIMREIPEREIESYSDKDHIILCLI